MVDRVKRFSRRSHSIRARGAALFAVSAAALAIAAIGSQGAAIAAPSQPYYMVVSGADLSTSAHYTPAQIDAQARAAGGSVQGGSGVASTQASASPDAAVQPYSVASGFVLYNPGYKRSSYVYDSDWGPIQEVACSSTCKVIDKWQTQVHEYVQGGPSKLWVLTMNAQHLFGTESPYFDYWYACSINVSGSPDHYCGNGADVSPESAVLNPGESIYRYFENNSYSNTEYPMIGITVNFSHSSGENKYRLADVCTSKSSSTLCATTGNGTGGTHTW